MPHTNDSIDNSVLKALESGPMNFQKLSAQTPFGKVSSASDEGRQLDRRLQTLRKAGKITFTTGKWTLVKP